LNLFSVPFIATSTSLEHHQIADYVREKLSKHNRYTSYYDRDVNEAIKQDNPWRHEMERCMKTVSKLMLKERKLDCPEHLDYWFSVYNDRDDHVLHTHPGAVVAGTYYAYADEESSVIRFRSPYNTLIQHAERNDNTDFLYFNHYPRTGDMNVWPVWLEHEVRPQRAVDHSRSRVAISFNYGKLNDSRAATD
jgi:uncharacterized protein (TIGR02466 family)